MQLSELLTAAKEYLTPATWGKGDGGSCAYKLLAAGRSCALMSIASTCQNDGQSAARTDVVVNLFGQVATGCAASAIRCVPQWNDAPERTLQDVHDAFDAAIAIARSQEADTSSRTVDAVARTPDVNSCIPVRA